MKAVAVTGSFGSGKSTVLKFARSLRLPSIDSDRVVAALYRDPEVKKRLFREFGSSSKRGVALIAFSSPSKRHKLESILHPLAWAEIKNKLSLLKKRGKTLAFVEVPLLFEAGWQGRFDESVFVKCSRKKCLKRLAAKGFPKEEAVLRFRAQLPQWKKIKRAQHTIDNNGCLASTGKQVRGLIAKLSS